MFHRLKFLTVIASIFLLSGLSLQSFAGSEVCSMLNDVPEIKLLKIGDSFQSVRDLLKKSTKIEIRQNKIVEIDSKLVLAEVEELSAEVNGVEIIIFLREDEKPWFKRWFEFIQENEVMTLKFDHLNNLSEIKCKEVLTGP